MYKRQGQVVSTVRCPELPYNSLLLVELLNGKGEPAGRCQVAADPIGAGDVYKRQIFACMRNANVYMDLSEYELAPMADVYVDALNKMIGDKVIFASAHPFIEQADAIEIYKNLNISEEVREKVMYKTAAKILGLDKGVSFKMCIRDSNRRSNGTRRRAVRHTRRP